MSEKNDEHPLRQLSKPEADQLQPLSESAIRDAIDKGNQERLAAGECGTVSTALEPAGLRFRR